MIISVAPLELQNRKQGPGLVRYVMDLLVCTYSRNAARDSSSRSLFCLVMNISLMNK